jgi:hypothetical protein
MMSWLKTFPDEFIAFSQLKACRREFYPALPSSPAV